MRLKSVHVQNLCCLLDANLECEHLTALVGPSGCGKSSFLRALELFFSPTPKYTSDDFYNRDTDREIIIGITFNHITDLERTLFSTYLEADSLTVTRILSLTQSRQTQRFYGLTFAHSGFASVRAAPNMQEEKAVYESLRIIDHYGDLPKWSSRKDTAVALIQWEVGHPEQCERSFDNGEFFGLTEKSRGNLGASVHFVRIPAVRDASTDTEEGKGNAISDIIDAVVRDDLLSSDNYKKISGDVAHLVHEVTRDTDLVKLSNQITDTLRAYAPNILCEVSWSDNSAINIPVPQVRLVVIEDGFPVSVAKTGHGVQRSVIMGMLQHVALIRMKAIGLDRMPGMITDEGAEQVSETRMMASSGSPTLVLAIEEPELYQYPNRQRYLSNRW